MSTPMALARIAYIARSARLALVPGRLRETLFWTAFSCSRRHHFVILRRKLSAPAPSPPPPPDVHVEAWSANRLRSWRTGRAGLRLEFFRDEIDDVDTAIWRPGFPT